MAEEASGLKKALLVLGAGLGSNAARTRIQDIADRERSARSIEEALVAGVLNNPEIAQISGLDLNAALKLDERLNKEKLANVDLLGGRPQTFLDKATDPTAPRPGNVGKLDPENQQKVDSFLEQGGSAAAANEFAQGRDFQESFDALVAKGKSLGMDEDLLKVMDPRRLVGEVDARQRFNDFVSKAKPVLDLENAGDRIRAFKEISLEFPEFSGQLNQMVRQEGGFVTDPLEAMGKAERDIFLKHEGDPDTKFVFGSIAGSVGEMTDPQRATFAQDFETVTKELYGNTISTLGRKQKPKEADVNKAVNTLVNKYPQLEGSREALTNLLGNRVDDFSTTTLRNLKLAITNPGAIATGTELRNQFNAFSDPSGTINEANEALQSITQSILPDELRTTTRILRENQAIDSLENAQLDQIANDAELFSIEESELPTIRAITASSPWKKVMKGMQRLNGGVPGYAVMDAWGEFLLGYANVNVRGITLDPSVARLLAQELSGDAAQQAMNALAEGGNMTTVNLQSFGEIRVPSAIDPVNDVKDDDGKDLSRGKRREAAESRRLAAIQLIDETTQTSFGSGFETQEDFDLWMALSQTIIASMDQEIRLLDQGVTPADVKNHREFLDFIVTELKKTGQSPIGTPGERVAQGEIRFTPEQAAAARRLGIRVNQITGDQRVDPRIPGGPTRLTPVDESGEPLFDGNLQRALESAKSLGSGRRRRR